MKKVSYKYCKLTSLGAEISRRYFLQYGDKYHLQMPADKAAVRRAWIVKNGSYPEEGTREHGANLIDIKE